MKRTGNDIGAEGARKISESLAINTALTMLQLGGSMNRKLINDKWLVSVNKKNTKTNNRQQYWR